MNKIIQTTFLSGLGILYSPTIACAYEAWLPSLVRFNEQDPTERLTKFKTKMSAMSNDQIAALTAKSGSFFAHKNDEVGYILKWNAPLRVVVQDQNGDLDLTIFPGKDIKQYLDDLAAFTHIPITITPRAKHDNNVSIMLGALRGDVTSDDEERYVKYGMSRAAFVQWMKTTIRTSDPTTGAIFGVPELNEQARTLDNVLLGQRKPKQSPTEGWMVSGNFTSTENNDPEPLYGNVGMYRVNGAIKACLLLIPSSQDHPELTPPRNVRFYLDNFFPRCLGLDIVNDDNTQRSLIVNHNFYALRLLYNQAIKPGMKTATAKNIMLHILDQ